MGAGVGSGVGVTTGAAVTTAVGSECLVTDPSLPARVSRTRSVAPRSAWPTVYVAALASRTVAQAAPFSLQRCQVHLAVTGGSAGHVAAAVSTEPTWAAPVITGPEVMTGGSAAVLRAAAARR